MRANWRQLAACRDVVPGLFFPIGTAQPALLQAEEAKQVCRRCPVQSQCLAWALDHKVTGIWGGTTEDERRLIAKAPGNAANEGNDSFARVPAARPSARSSPPGSHGTPCPAWQRSSPEPPCRGHLSPARQSPQTDPAFHAREPGL
jgi:WhiB family redox-sensing transcriptional regulator